MQIALERMLEVFEQETSPDVMDASEAVDFTKALIEELIYRQDGLEYLAGNGQ